MSSALETLLEAARFIELQEQREQRLTSTSSSSSLSTSPYSNSRYSSQLQCGQQMVATPPDSPITSSDGLHRNHLVQNGDYAGTTIIRMGKWGLSTNERISKILFLTFISFIPPHLVNRVAFQTSHASHFNLMWWHLHAHEFIFAIY